MKLNRDNDEYIGTPEEIAELIRLLGGQSPVQEIEQGTYPPDDFAPLEDVVSESQKLRQNLAANPMYNPYPGVVPSNEDRPVDIPVNNNLDDVDTGVSYA